MMIAIRSCKLVISYIEVQTSIFISVFRIDINNVDKKVKPAAFPISEI